MNIHGEKKIFSRANAFKLGPAFFCGIIIFIVTPFEIIRNNALDIGSPVIPFAYSLIFFLLFEVLSFCIGTFVKSVRVCSVYNKFLFCLGVFFLLSDVISPLLIGPIARGNEVPVEDLQGIFSEIVICVILFVMAVKTTSKYINKFSWIFGVAILVVEIMLTVSFVPRLAAKKTVDISQGLTGAEVSFEGNIYQITFDEYSSLFFLQAVKMLALENEFVDFDFYLNARSNYIATQMSVPSFSTGRLYKGNSHLKDWLEQTPQHSVVTKLKHLGFKTTFYSPYNHSWHFPASTVIKAPVSLANLADLCLLRLVPTILRQEVYSNSGGIISGLVNRISPLPRGESYVALKQFEQLLKTEPQRDSQKEYIYAHFFLPHPPNTLLRDGTYAPHRSSFSEEILLATNMMALFINRLKELDRYDSSLIILQSDHGTGWATALDKKNIERTKPLLLVKLPHAKKKEMKVVNKLVQLVDLKAGILSVLSQGASSKNTEIRKNFLPLKETVDVYQVYGYRKRPGGRTYRIGQDYLKGIMNWCTIDSQGTMTSNPPIAVEW